MHRDHGFPENCSHECSQRKIDRTIVHKIVRSGLIFKIHKQKISDLLAQINNSVRRTVLVWPHCPHISFPQGEGYSLLCVHESDSYTPYTV